MKYEPRKVFVLENNEYIEISAKEHQHRKETDPQYTEKHFILVQGYLLETSKEFRDDFQRDKDRYRYIRKLDAQKKLLSIEAFDTEDENGIDLIDSSTESIAELVADKMMIEKLYQSLEFLDNDERILIDALFFQGMSEREYAAVLGVYPNAVHKRKTRILEKLKKILKV